MHNLLGNSQKMTKISLIKYTGSIAKKKIGSKQTLNKKTKENHHDCPFFLREHHHLKNETSAEHVFYLYLETFLKNHPPLLSCSLIQNLLSNFIV